MPEYVRVRDSSGHKISVRKDDVVDGQTLLDEPAARNGKPLPPTYRVPLGGDPAPSAVSVPRTRRKPRSKPEPTPVPATDVAVDETPAMQADTEEEN